MFTKKMVFVSKRYTKRSSTLLLETEITIRFPLLLPSVKIAVYEKDKTKSVGEDGD